MHLYMSTIYEHLYMSVGMAVNIEGKCSRTQTVTVIKDPGEHALMQLRSLRNEQAHHINGMIVYQASSYFVPQLGWLDSLQIADRISQDSFSVTIFGFMPCSCQQR